MRKRNHYPVAAFLLLLALLFGGCSYNQSGLDTQAIQENTQKSYELTDIPAYAGNSFVILDDNKPAFSKKDRERTDAFETYSDLDELGRCGVAYANICKELMPTEERGAIGMVKPTGWHTAKYDNVDGKYLYNRCHLIAYQLTGENANNKNLITGTRSFNVDGMLPYEEMVGDYVRETGNHVLYRVTPVFDGDDLVAKGVQMEAMSVEDKGGDIKFNVFVSPERSRSLFCTFSFVSEYTKSNPILLQNIDTSEPFSALQLSICVNVVSTSAGKSPSFITSNV